MIAAGNVRTDEEAKAIVDLVVDNLKVYFDCICDYRQTADKDETIEAQNYYCPINNKIPHTKSNEIAWIKRRRCRTYLYRCIVPKIK